MRVLSELPVELLKYAYHSSLGKSDVKEMMKYLSSLSSRQLDNDEYGVSSHNHSCDGKTQKIKDILKQASLKGGKIVVITDHNTNEHFNEQIGDKVVGYYNFDGKIIYAIRGMECNCMVGKNGKFKDLVFAGYRNPMRSGMPLDEAIEYARESGALIGITSPLNEPFFGLAEEEIERLMTRRKVDYIETLNASKGFPFFHNDAIAGIMLREYNGTAEYGKKIGGIYVSDSHVKSDVMTAFFGIRKKDFEFLESDPQKVEREPELLIEGLRNAFRNNTVTNYGGYKRLSDLLNDPELFAAFSNQAVKTWKDYFRLRFSKYRERNS